MSGDSVVFDVPPEAINSRLDVFLARHLDGVSRSAIRRLVLDGRVRVGDHPAAKPGIALQIGMRIVVELPDVPPSDLVPEPIPLETAYEDEDLLVVVKPAGLVVHPGHGRRSGTLVNALLARGTPLAAAGGRDRPGIVHRLDRETSGLLVVAKTDTAHRALASAFAQRKVRKVYLALVWGHPDPAEGTVDAGIGRSRSDPTRMSTRAPRRRDALTTFATCERMPGFALLRVQLVTGRTHQIRVHMQSLHHPIVGDARYGAQPWRGVRDPRKRMALAAFQRIALHAAELSFTHPVTGRTIELTAPLPREFEDLLSVLREVP